MAEIRIEKKKPVWPWILLGLIILGIILYFVFAGNDNESSDMEENNTEQMQDTTYSSTRTGEGTTTTMAGRTNQSTTSNGDKVSTYLAHIGNQDRMGVDHEYTNNALVHLIEAVDSKAKDLNVDINQDLQEIREDAQQITQNPQATNHANKIKDAGTKIASVLEKLQKEKFPELSNDVEEVKTAANKINASVSTLEQKNNINSFFNEAADVLKRMS